MGRNDRKGRAGRKGLGGGRGLGEPFRDHPLSPLERTAYGAVGGAFVGCLALLVGALNIALALASGTKISFDELEPLFFYLAAFVVAGGVMGLLGPITRTRVGRYVLGMVGAGVALLIMTRGFFGPYSGWEAHQWVITLGLSLVFGIVIARHLNDW
ncbi:MAG TPA: hypothetical protein VE913_01110 [Longimicrobium sp.]|nr:hypothetical protein [Longimicrobium sp.]